VEQEEGGWRRRPGQSDKADVSQGLGKRKIKVWKGMILGKNSNGWHKGGEE
jgi:hypothetical protein